MATKASNSNKVTAVFGAMFWEVVALVVLPKVLTIVENKVKAKR